MSPQVGIFDEVAALEKRLLDAQRGQANAEANSRRIGDLLASEKRAHAEVSKELGIASERVTVLEQEVGHLKGIGGRLSESERKQFAAEKSAANFEKDLIALGTKYGRVLSERDDARGKLTVSLAEVKRLKAEVDPARVLATAIVVWEATRREMLEQAQKIRGEE